MAPKLGYLAAMKKAFILRTMASIHPFGDEPGAAWIGNMPLSEALRRELELAGFQPAFAGSPQELPRGGDFLLVPDHLFASMPFLKAFGEAAKRRDFARCVVPRSPVTDWASPLSGATVTELYGRGECLCYDLYSVRNWGGFDGVSHELLGALRELSRPVVVEPEYTVRELRRPNVGPAPWVARLPVSEFVIGHVRSWVHILWLNQLLTGLYASRAIKDAPAGDRLRIAALRSTVPGVVTGSVIGRYVDIHPTARVEGSAVGEGVRIGADAYVKDCLVGDDVVIADHARFINCVIGDRCNSLADSFFKDCTFYPDSTLSNVNLMQCVAGRHVFLTAAVLCLLESPERPVEVFHEGRMTPAGRWFLGSCMGHDTILGTRAIMMPGLALPNGVIIVMPPGEGVNKIPQIEPGTPIVWEKGTLKPLGDVFPDAAVDEVGAG
ncbi:MAG: hypothetical protein WC889_11825 [Myxococcota bacterium]|jgi:hypothetical protein